MKLSFFEVRQWSFLGWSYIPPAWMAVQEND